ncbi:MAG TPA: patatin-like phospholipase family protein [Burkholderiales bacterium]|nr:patatin-like phospholipase family protein [Burkholderiales bacterium]
MAATSGRRRDAITAHTICLGLQGGGSHGAYTWGVLDRLLDEPEVRIEALSGASAGAMNAAVFAHGYLRDGRRGAQRALERFWKTVGTTAVPLFPAPPATPDAATSAYVSLTRYFSPYQLNPFNINPLRAVVSEQIDFELLRRSSPVRLFISATRVRDGALRIFTERELTPEALLASACIPSLHHAVSIDGESYWDGALTANPPVSPLVYDCDAPDVVIVALTPKGNAAPAPSTADAIVDRFNQISFSAALSTELRSVADAMARARRARFTLGAVDSRLRALRLQVLEAAPGLAALDAATRFKTDAAFIASLHAHGRRAADEWLQRRWRDTENGGRFGVGAGRAGELTFNPL